MSLRERFAFLERRRTTHEELVVPVSKRFETLGEDVRATPSGPAYTVPVREPTSVDTAQALPPVPDEWRDRLPWLLLIAWGGPRLARTIRSMVSTSLTLVILLLLAAFGLFGRACMVLRGDYDRVLQAPAQKAPAAKPAP